MPTATHLALPGFSQESRALVRRLEDAGVTFRLSTKNHAIGTAPMGMGTVSIPRRLSRANRSMQNATRDAERMIRDIKAVQATVEPVMPTVQALGKAADALLAGGGTEVGDTIIMNGITKKHAKVTEAIKEPVEAVDVVSTKPWMAHGYSSIDGGKMYPSPTTNERTWSDGTVDYVCSYCNVYTHDNPKAVVSHYSRSKSHPKVARPTKPDMVPAVDYTEPLTHRHSPTQSRVDAILAILAKHPDADTTVPLPDLIRLILAADMERDPLYERGIVGSDEGPLDDAGVIARIRVLVGASTEAELKARITELEALVNDRTALLAEAEAEVGRLREERKALRELLAEEGS